MTQHERKIIEFLAGSFGCDANYFSFAAIIAETGLDRKSVRRACRSLTRQGLAQNARGLSNEDGHMMGSGYAATKEGVEAAG